MDRALQRVISRTQRRLRIQRALEAATTCGVVSILAATLLLYALKADLLSARASGIGTVLAAALPLLAALVVALGRIPAAYAAKRLDQTHDLHDRIGTALEFSAQDEPTAFMQAQIEDCLRHVPAVQPSRAAPFRSPRALRELGLLLLCFGVVALLHFPRPLAPPPRARSLPKLSLSADELMPYQALTRELQREGWAQDQPELAELAATLNRLLLEIERRELTRQELFAKLAELERKHFAGLEGDFKDLLERLKHSGRELEREKLTAEAGKALAQSELPRAKEALEQLSRQLKQLNAAEQRRVANSLERAAREQPKGEELQRKREQLEQQIRRLQRQLKQQAKNSEERRRLERRQRQLERLNQQERERAAQQRQLERLNQQLQQAAEQLRSRLSPEAMKALQQAAQQLGRLANQLDKLRLLDKAQTQIVDLKELLRRAGAKGGGSGKDGKEGRLKDFLARAGGKAGQGGQRVAILDPQGQGQGGNLILPLPGAGSGTNPGNAQSNRGQGQDSPNGQPGDGIGNSHDPNLQGKGTQLESRRRDVMVQGAENEGPTRSEVILGAAEQGFATARYRRVYHDYTQIIEEALKREDVPLGYKYYVKRYFQLIKPR